MLRCCQLILRSPRNNNSTWNAPLIVSSSNIKLQRVHYAIKFNIRDTSSNNTGPIESSPSDVRIAPVSGSPRRLNRVSVYTPLTPSEQPSRPTCFDSATGRQNSTRISGDSHIHSNELQADSRRVKSPNTEFQVDLVRPTDPRRTALPQDPPLDPAGPNGFNSPSSLASAHELATRIVDNSLVRRLRHMDLSNLKSSLQHFGPQLLRTLPAGKSAELLCLFGSLSDDENARIFDMACGARSRNLARVDFWDGVVLFGEIKEEVGPELGEKEVYWLMRAYLDRWKRTGSSGALHLAKLWYTRLTDKTRSEPTVVIPYLGTFLTSPSTPGFGEALTILCNLCLQETNLHRGIAELFWRTILLNCRSMSPEYKSTILNVVQSRISNSVQSKSQGTGPLSIIGPLSINDLVMGLTAIVFPNYRRSELPAHVFSWLTGCARESTGEGVAIDDRFSNLVLLAMWLLPQEISGSPEFRATPHSLGWRAVIGLAVLDQSLHSQATTLGDRGEVRETREIARSLWRLWRDGAMPNSPAMVNRALIVTFLHTAARLRDKSLVNACIKEISSHMLTTLGDAESEAGQVEQLFAVLAECIVVLGGQTWVKTLDLLADVMENPSHRDICHQRVLERLGAHDSQLAHRFYNESLLRGMMVSPAASLLVAQKLALDHRWDQVIPYLQDRRFGDKPLEQLLETILLAFQSCRNESTLPSFAKAVGDALLARFSETYLPDRLKYPTRFFLPIMIASHHPLEAVQVLEALLCNNPIMFSARYFLRIIHSLLRHRHPALATRVLEVAVKACEGKPPVINDLVRKTKRGLARIGVANLDIRHPLVGSPSCRDPKDLRDSIVTLASRRPSWSTRKSLLGLTSILKTSSVTGGDVLALVQALTRNRHFALARSVIGRTHGHLKPVDLTAICNAYLHAPLSVGNSRNGRLVRHVLRSKNFLTEKYKFIPDRVTVNILIKSMFRWRTYIHSRKVLALFDHLIRNGYPASERWLGLNGVPFGTSPGQMPLDLSGVRPEMSFRRHVQPLYKMFITELFLRKERRAAHRIIGILKEEEALAAEKKRHREQARRAGRLKKQRKRALVRRGSGEFND